MAPGQSIGSEACAGAYSMWSSKPHICQPFSEQVCSRATDMRSMQSQCRQRRATGAYGCAIVVNRYHFSLMGIMPFFSFLGNLSTTSYCSNTLHHYGFICRQAMTQNRSSYGVRSAALPSTQSPDGPQPIWGGGGGEKGGMGRGQTQTCTTPGV